MGDHSDLIVYKKAFELSMQIFQLTKNFPRDEVFGLTSQIRRSSRSVCANVGEGYRKRRYEAHFISKLTDADMENTETQIWLEFAEACGYITTQIRNELYTQTQEIGKLLNYMLRNPEKFTGKF